MCEIVFLGLFYVCKYFCLGKGLVSLFGEVKCAIFLFRGISNEEKVHLRQKLLSHLREENYQVLHKIPYFLHLAKICIPSSVSCITLWVFEELCFVSQMKILNMYTSIATRCFICYSEFCLCRLHKCWLCSFPKLLALTILENGIFLTPFFSVYALV